MLVALARKYVAQHRDLGIDVLRFDRHIEIRLHQISIPFWNLVLPDLMRSIGIPRQLVDQAMILMRVVAAMSEDEVNVVFDDSQMLDELYTQTYYSSDIRSHTISTNIYWAKTDF